MRSSDGTNVPDLESLNISWFLAISSVNKTFSSILIKQLQGGRERKKNKGDKKQTCKGEAG